MQECLAAVALGLLLALSGCSPVPVPVPVPVPAPAPAAQAADPPRASGDTLFEQAFQPGFSLRHGGEKVDLEVRTIGRLRSRSGRLVACDPFACERARPFAQPVPQGEFELRLALVRFGTEQRVALARLSFLPGPVRRWEPALVAGEDAARGHYGYGVDTGTGAFLDGAAWQAYSQRMRREPEAFAESLLREFDRNAAPSRSWLLFEMEEGGVALFSSGWGDGGYASYWGYDGEGRLAALLTDFQVLQDAAEAGGDDER
ncbi:DUF4241 domain-containing protein [Caldimonas tepidiphila]|uniref:DUF4241 domain-containing protein n=1 Tax=Caldimonas tepidiphila TaxID=2315841 RepID=UPI000E5B1AC4|nr:DUF4241 domain-containing protein [Caldimonas tepidiphila]